MTHLTPIFSKFLGVFGLLHRLRHFRRSQPCGPGLLLCTILSLAACGGGGGGGGGDSDTPSDKPGNGDAAAPPSAPRITPEQLLSCPTDAQSPVDFSKLACFHGSAEGLGHVEGSDDMTVPCTIHIDNAGIRLQVKDQVLRLHTMPPAPAAVSSYVRFDSPQGISINLQVDLFADKDDTIVDGVHVGFDKAQRQPGAHRLSVISTKDGIEQSCAVDF